MSEVAMRIWAARGMYDDRPDSRYHAPAEYVRADIADAWAAERDALRAEIQSER